MSSQPIQIPALPEHLDRALREQAAAEGKPLDVVVVETLERGLKPNGRGTADLDVLVGSWEDDPAFDEAIAAFESVDEDMWR